MNSLSLNQVVSKAKRAERLIKLTSSILMIVAVGGMIMLLGRLWHVRTTDRERANAAMNREVEEQKRKQDAKQSPSRPALGNTPPRAPYNQPVANVIDLTSRKTER